jgi:hypothetical protein
MQVASILPAKRCFRLTIIGVDSVGSCFVKAGHAKDALARL